MTKKATDNSSRLPGKKNQPPSSMHSMLREWLNNSDSIGSDCSGAPDILKELISVLNSNRQTIAEDIRSDTGKSTRAALSEVSRAISAIESALFMPDSETIGTRHPGFGKMQFISGSKRTGDTLIIPDNITPVLSTIEKLVPSILTRKHSLVFSPAGASIALSHLFNDFLGNIKDLPAFFARDPEYRLLRWYVSNYWPLNILFSGPDILFQKIRRFSGAIPLSAESQSGYSVFASNGSDLDRLAETSAGAILDRSLPKFLRPSEIVVLADDAEYLRNRLITELEKSDEPWVTQDHQQAETYASKVKKGKMSHVDIHFWNGYESGVFSPALLSPVSNQDNSFRTETDLPVLIIHEAKSLAEAIDLQAKSQNRMYSSIWTSDADLIQQAISSLNVSLLTVNGFPTGTEENIINTAVNGLPVRWVRSLTQFMSTNFRGLLYS